MSQTARRRLSRAALFASCALLLATAVLLSAPGSVYSPREKAFYVDQAVLNFIRPGLVKQIVSAEISPAGVISVRYRLRDPRGLGLDRLGVSTPGTISTSFIATVLPRGASQYVSYTTRVQTSPITGRSAVQAAADTGGRFEQVGEGEYVYTFGTRAPVGYDRSATHTIGIYGSRNLSEWELGSNYDDDVFHFVPDGSRPGAVRDVIKTATCNKCHQDLAFHGGSRKTMEVCVLCHTPQTTDPDTGNTVDMPTMAHKIHMGARLPSVVAGKPYVIIGNRQSVHDYSHVNFVAGPNRCNICHQPGAAQANAWNNATRASCGACHDNVNFATGENHFNLVQANDNACTICHTATAERDFDISIPGAHTISGEARALKGVVFKILEVHNTTPGSKPTVVFTIHDRDGNPILPSQMTRLSLVLAGPASTDYSGYTSESALAADGANGRYNWTFMVPTIPADAKGTWSVSLEGRREVVLPVRGTTTVTARDTGNNQVFYFSVDRTPVTPRRAVVSLAKCNACHGKLAFHGQVRNSTDHCVVCHNPNRLAGTGAAAQSVSMQLMIHKIHRASGLSRDYIIGTTNFRNGGFPGIISNCSGCHVNGSENLPLIEGLLPVQDPKGLINPAQPTTAACMSCHDGRQAAAHAALNTSPTLGEACSTCHGPTSAYSVAKSHAR